MSTHKVPPGLIATVEAVGFNASRARLLCLLWCLVSLGAMSTAVGTQADTKSIVPLPTVHVVTKAIRFQAKNALLVRSITVGNLDGGELRVSCNRCRRYPTKIHETRPNPTTKSYSGVSWIIVDGRDIQVELTHSGQVGRFLLMGASGGHALVFRTSGCLSKQGRHVKCPNGATQPRPGTSVPRVHSLPTQTPITPSTKILTGPSTLQTTLPAAFTYSSSIASSTFQCSLDGLAWSSCPTSGITYSIVAEGDHTFSVRALAPGGLVDPAPPTLKWTQDTPPDTTITSGPSGTITTGNVTFEFSSNKSGSSFQCDLDGGQWSPCSGRSQSYSSLGEGSHVFSVRAVDSLGVVDPAPASQDWDQVSPYGVTSYDRLQPGAPYHGVFESAYQAFVAQSNTITSLGVTVGNPGYTAGAAIGFNVQIKLCTNQPDAQGNCNAIGAVSPQVVNYGDSQGNVGEVAVTPGATYWLVYLPPQPLGSGWVTYWWSGGPHITESEQMQAIVQGYNR